MTTTDPLAAPPTMSDILAKHGANCEALFTSELRKLPGGIADNSRVKATVQLITNQDGTAKLDTQLELVYVGFVPLENQIILTAVLKRLADGLKDTHQNSSRTA